MWEQQIIEPKHNFYDLVNFEQVPKDTCSYFCDNFLDNGIGKLSIICYN